MAMYDAFISYSHAKDKPIAGALQSVIQKLGKPWYRRRALRVFRDDTSLSATPHLWPSIEQALGHSRYFILLASREAAASKWVNREVDFWLQNKSADTLLIGVTDGELSWDESIGDFTPGNNVPLPPVLARRFPAEPKWVDLRSHRNAVNPRNAGFIELGADFAAAIHGIPKEDLLSQEVRQQRRALKLACSAAGLLLILVGLAAWQWREALAQRNRAERTLAQATETANGLVFDLARRFRDSGLPAELVKEILDRARDLQEQLVGGGQVTAALRHSEGAALLETVTTLLRIGDTTAALSAADRARLIFESLLASGDESEDWASYVAASYGNIGDVLEVQGDLAGALKSYQAAFDIYQRLVAADSKLPFDLNRYRRRQQELAVAYSKLGDVLLVQGELDETLKNYQASLEIRERLADSDWNNAELQRALAMSYNKLGSVLADVAVSCYKAGDTAGMRSKLEEALKNYQESLAILQRLATADRGNTALKRDLAVAYDKVADVLGGQGKLEESLRNYQESLAIMERLAASDRSNSGWQYDLAVTHGHIGDLLKAQGKLDQALASYRQQLLIVERLAASDRANFDLQRHLSTACINVGDILFEQSKLDDAFKLFQECVEKQRVTTSVSSEVTAKISGRIGNLAFRFLLARNFAQALEAADQAISLTPSKLWLYTNRAHALMLLGRTDEARALYLQYSSRPKVEGEKSWQELILEDFVKMRSAGISHPLMDEIEAKFGARG